MGFVVEEIEFVVGKMGSVVDLQRMTLSLVVIEIV
jgi:hypothetical protein